MSVASSSPSQARSPYAATRGTYRHGDLRRALVQAGVELARHGGPGAVVLRETTRRAGVAPNAAYRHFANHEDLLAAVRAEALATAARHMEAHLPVRAGMEESAWAKAALRGVGAGYLRFARQEPGLFRAAFTVNFQVSQDVPADPAMAGDSGRNPFQLLGDALDALVRTGLLPAPRRAGAEFLAWSAVHGMALLVLDGPLREAPGARLDALADGLLGMVERGLTA